MSRPIAISKGRHVGKYQGDVLAANLHGEPTSLAALSNLAVLAERNVSHITTALAMDLPVLARHCTATDAQFQAAQDAYRRKLDVAIVAGMSAESYHTRKIKDARTAFRRISR